MQMLQSKRRSRLPHIFSSFTEARSMHHISAAKFARVTLLIFATVLVSHGKPVTSSGEEPTENIWKKLEPFFAPPPEFANDFGKYPSPLKFYDGRMVESPADWQSRRAEILKTWHERLGPWPELL